VREIRKLDRGCVFIIVTNIARSEMLLALNGPLSDQNIVAYLIKSTMDESDIVNAVCMARQTLLASGRESRDDAAADGERALQEAWKALLVEKSIDGRAFSEALAKCPKQDGIPSFMAICLIY
jgi:hypothetical protein